MKTFYLGVHMPQWLWREEAVDGVPLFISNNSLRERKSTFPPARTRWALDSGGFTQIQKYGEWVVSPEEYVESTRRYVEELGSLDWAAPQDWMCEPHMVEKTGLSVEIHQHRTVENYLLLRQMAPELPFRPVLQGQDVASYIRCAMMYEDAGIDLLEEPLVGVGSVCRRQSSTEIGNLFRMLAFEGFTNLHGFGVKVEGIRKYGEHLASSDSMAWSMGARYELDEGRTCPKKACNNCLHYALEWRERILREINI